MGSSSPNRRLVYDEVRQSWVKATPEEVVRQRWLRALVDALGYPKELLAVEKEIKELPHLKGCPVPDRRVDILCYGNVDGGLVPLLLIECKEGALSDAALDQVVGYNHFVKAHCAAIVNGSEAKVAGMGQCNNLPSFKELLQWAKR